MKISLNARRSIIASAAGTVIAAYGIGKPAAASTTLYWDAYGATPVASYGVWDSADTGNNIWNSDSNISSGSVLTNWPAASTALTNDVAYFNYNTTNAGIQTVNVSGGVSTLQITEQAGSVSFYGVTSSSPSLTIGGSGITCTGNQVGQYMYFDASLGKVLISGSQEWDYNTGQTRNWTFNASVGSLATAGQTQALYVWTGGGPQTFNGAITDGAGGGKLQLSRMITGGSVWATTINAANTYSGGTVADSGLLWFGSAATAGSGPVYMVRAISTFSHRPISTPPTTPTMVKPVSLSDHWADRNRISSPDRCKRRHSSHRSAFIGLCFTRRAELRRLTQHEFGCSGQRVNVFWRNGRDQRGHERRSDLPPHPPPPPPVPL